ncbi:MAG: hypothetical protein JXD22_13185 [Sedimentisphaerales bacterium]|nr:hypothetical protein [Sedimentisphaerales bacterium]
MAKQSKKKKKTEENPFELALPVSDKVEIFEVRLIECECKQTPLADQGKQVLDYKYSVKAELDKERSQILLLPEFKMTAKPEKSAADKLSLSIQAKFLLAYTIDSTAIFTKKNIDAFGQINGIYNAWPYWREFVQATIARMGLPKLVIPVFRFRHEERTEEEKPKQSKKTAVKRKAKKKVVKV